MNTEEILKVENPFKQSFYDWMNSLADIKDRDRMMMEVAVNWAVRNLTASQSEQGYSEAEVKELLRQQREKCARAYLDNFKNHGILNAPEPQLKSSVT
jgi:uncharacterized protein YdgA (DUF945 family)